MSIEMRRNAYIGKTREAHIIGSARAFDEYPNAEVRSVLAAAQHNHLINHYGGHDRAASFDMPAANFDAFADLVLKETAKQFPGGIPPHVINYDFVLYHYELTPDMWRAIAPLAPFGKGNPEPIIAARDVRVLGVYPSEHNPKNFQVMLKTGENTRIYAKVKNQPDFADRLKKGNLIDLLFTVDKNSYSGNIELILVDWRPAPMNRARGRVLD
jgi:single-stranded-DNA-specific exonuclease